MSDEPELKQLPGDVYQIQKSELRKWWLQKLIDDQQYYSDPLALYCWTIAWNAWVYDPQAIRET